MKAVFAFIFISLSFSCQKESISDSFQPPLSFKEELNSSILSKDANMNSLVIAFETIRKETQNYTNKELKDLQIKIRVAEEKDLSKKDQYNFIFNDLKINKSNFLTFEKVINSSLEAIHKKFGSNIKDSIIENAINIIVKNKIKSSSLVGGGGGQLDFDCKTDYVLCDAAVISGGTIALLGCEAITFGWGTGLCVSSVYVGVAAGMLSCTSSYEKCLKANP